MFFIPDKLLGVINIFNHSKIRNTVLKSKALVTPDLIVHSGIIELDRLTGGFKAGELTYIDGNSPFIYTIPNQLCVNTFRTFNSDTIYIDGGICADPYQIATYARSIEVDDREILDHVHISRAFTVYQLSTCIEHMLEKEIQTHDPRTLIIGRFPLLYQDIDGTTKESQTIMQNNLYKLQELTTDYNLITILTNTDNRHYNQTMRTLIQSQVNETVRMTQIEPCTYVDLLHRKKRTTIHHMANGQLRLDYFGLVT